MSSNDHFNTASTGVPTSPGRFVTVEDIAPLELVPGLEFRPVLGEKTMANFVHFEPRTEAPKHLHGEEQIVIVLQGELDFDIDGDTRTLRPGDVAIVPSWVSHGARTRDVACLEVDIFNPPRKTLLEHAAAQILDPDSRS
jgi:quercetin dioxygenase-like cupin family protein